MDAKLELLAKVPLFQGLDRTSLGHVARLADEIDLPADMRLLVEGDLPYEFFIVVDGQVRIERDGEVVNMLGPGDFLGEIALVDGGRRTATAITETPVRLLVLGTREFRSLLAEYPDIRESVLDQLAERVRRAENIEE
jgi:CRP/FNR family transcriptional regulator, cyclic AMP receptor protein